MLNKVIQEGRISSDITLRKAGKNDVANFRIAVERDYKDQNGNRQTDFFQCVVWGPSAKRIADWTGKGDLISIVGQLESGSYDDKNGNRVYYTQINIERWYQLESKTVVENRRKSGNSTTTQSTVSNTVPTNNTVTKPAPVQQSNAKSDNNQPDPNDSFADSKETIDLSDDDLPF